MSKKYNLAVFIGRMAPLHNAHVENIKIALDIADEVLVLLGSANAPRDERNPFTVDERCDMIDLALPDDGYVGILVDSINDQPSHDLWAAEVHKKAMQTFLPGTNPSDVKIAIVGHKKDDSSFYLDMFPTWDFIETGAHMHGDDEMAATKIREMMFDGNFDDAKLMMPKMVWVYVQATFIESARFVNLQAEYRFHKNYPAHRRANYPINDVTADAVVLCKGHILLIRRKNIPGKGMLALPGGFVQTDETVLDGAVRELIEETQLHMPEKVIRGSIVDELRFDKPTRSLRGRLMTFAFTIQIDTNHDGSLPRVYGSDDAAKAFWVPIADIMAPEKAADFFEDHHSIIMTMIGRVAKQ